MHPRRRRHVLPLHAALVVEHRVPDAQRLRRREVLPRGVAAVERGVGRHRAVVRRVPFEYRQTPRAVGGVAVLDDDVQRQPAASRGQVHLVPVVRAPSALDDDCPCTARTGAPPCPAPARVRRRTPGGGSGPRPGGAVRRSRAPSAARPPRRAPSRPPTPLPAAPQRRIRACGARCRAACGRSRRAAPCRAAAGSPAYRGGLAARGSSQR